MSTVNSITANYSHFGQQAVMPMHRSVHAPVMFGNTIVDEIIPDTKRDYSRPMLKFQEPRPIPWLQRMLMLINRWITLRSVKVNTSPQEAAKLKALPDNAGIILVGPHPDVNDAFFLYNLYYEAGKLPAGMLAASDIFERSRIWSFVLRAAGCVPVIRGGSNNEAVQYLTNKVAQGGWTGILSEGEIYWSRQVMTMEPGAVKIALDAALKAMENGDDRPIYIQPFAHTYFHKNLAQMRRNMEKAVAELESMPELFGKPRSGDVFERIEQVAGRIMEYKAKSNNLYIPGWQGMPFYQKADMLRQHILESLEREYAGGAQGRGNDHRRIMKMRVTLKKLAKNPKSSEQLEKLKTDLDKTYDVIPLMTLTPDYPQYARKYNDLEVWGELVQKLRVLMRVQTTPLGYREAIYKVLEPVDMRKAAEQYQSLGTMREKTQFVTQLTEDIRRNIQTAIDEIHRHNPRNHLQVQG